MGDVEVEPNVGVKRWGTIALDKFELASVVREAKTCNGKEEDNLRKVGSRGYDAV